MPSNQVSARNGEQRNDAAGHLDLTPEAKPGNTDDETPDQLVHRGHVS